MKKSSRGGYVFCVVTIIIAVLLTTFEEEIFPGANALETIAAVTQEAQSKTKGFPVHASVLAKHLNNDASRALSDADRERIHNVLKSTFQEETNSTRNEEWVDASGKEIFLHVATYPLYIDKGNPCRQYLFMMSITGDALQYSTIEADIVCLSKTSHEWEEYHE